MPSPLTFELIETEERLLALEAEWRGLFAEAGEPSPFLDFDWLLMCWRAVSGRDGTPLFAIVREAGRLVLGIGLERRRFRRIFFRYHGLSSRLPHNDDALMAPGAGAGRWITALQRGVRRTPLDTAIILKRLSSTSRFAQAAMERGKATLFAHSTFVDLTDGYARYLARFPSATRNQMKRMERRLDASGVAPFRLSSSESFDADFDWLLQNKRNWTPPGNKALRNWLSDSSASGDLRALGHKWIATGQMQLALVESDGRPVAGGLLLAAGRTMFFMVTTYDASVGRASPGRVLALKLAEWGAAHGQARLDFMAGDWDWKERLKTGGYDQYRFKLPLRSWPF